MILTSCVRVALACALCAGMTACGGSSPDSPTAPSPTPGPAAASAATAATLSTFDLAPSVVSGQTASGTVTLNAPAPEGGFLISLTVDNGAVTVPASVTIPARVRTLAFAVTTSRVTRAVDVAIEARAGDHALTASIRLQPVVTIDRLDVDPSLVGGQTTTGTVILSGAALEGGMVVRLSADHAAVTVPGSVTIAEGASSGTFTVTTRAVQSTVHVLVTARAGNDERTASIRLRSGTVPQLQVDASVVGGQTTTGIVTLTSAAPAGGVEVALSADNTAVTLPASVTVPAGATAAAFAITTAVVASNMDVIIAARVGEETQTASMRLRPVLLRLTQLQVPSTLVGGRTATGTLTVSAAAPPGGLSVTLSASSPALGVPASVTVPAGATSGSFTITSLEVVTEVDVTLTARMGEDTRTASLRLQVTALSVASLQLNPSTVTAGQTVTATARLNGTATEAVPVTFTANNVLVDLSSTTIIVPAGASSGSLTIRTLPVNSPFSVTIAATGGGQTRSTVLVLQPAPLASVTDTVTFSGLPASRSTFSTWVERGITVTATSGPWTTTNTSIIFYSAAGVTTTGELRVTAGGATFALTSADLYSSTTPIPYVFEGWLNGQRLYTVSATQGNTFGNYVRIANPRASDRIDTLIVRLTNPAFPCCTNPMGIDNIALLR